MRRSDREITSREDLEDLLGRCDVCRLGLCADGQPYIVPLNFGYRWDAAGLALYFHGARTGRKLEMIAGNPRVCVELDVVHGIRATERACQWSIGFESIIGEGIAAVVEDPVERSEALNRIMLHYSGRDDWAFDPRELAVITVVRVQVQTLSGKRLGKLS